MRILIAICVLWFACVPAYCDTSSNPGGALDRWLASDTAVGLDYPVVQPSPVTFTVIEQKTVVKPQAPRRTGYPVRGGHWTYPGHSRQALIAHLVSDGIHRGKFTMSYLNSLSYQELLSLHDDDHEGRVKRGYVNNPLKAAPKSVRKQENKQAKEYGQAVYGTADGKHPGPLGAAIRGALGDPRYRNPTVRYNYYFYSDCPNGNCPRG